MRIFLKNSSMLSADQVNFLSKLSFRKVTNVVKTISSFYFSKLTKASFHWGLPLTVTIEPTTACNLRCPECPSGLRSFTRATGSLKKDLFEQAVDALSKDALFLMFYFQGEPFLNPELFEMIEYASRKKLYTITSTNGHFFDDTRARKTVESKLDRLIISIDGLSQEVYENYRKEGKLETVIRGVKNITRWKKKLNAKRPKLVLQFLVVRPNEHQIPDVLDFARDLEFDEIRFKTAQIYDFKNGHPLIPTQERYSRYKRKNDGTYRIKNNLSNQCWRLWHTSVITWDGQILPCCFDKDANHNLGNLSENSFQTIWNGSKYRAFRTQLLKGRKNIDICKNCSEGCKIWS